MTIDSVGKPQVAAATAPLIQQKQKGLGFFGSPMYSTAANLEAGGLVGDICNAMRLAPFYSEQASNGVASAEAIAVAEVGSLAKNTFGALLFLKNFEQMCAKGCKLVDGSINSFSEAVWSGFDAVASFFATSKCVVDGMEVSQGLGFLSKETVKTWKPFGLAGTAFSGLREATFKDIPNLYRNVGKDNAEVAYSLLKLAKSVSLVAVGSLALAAVFFKVAFSPWLIPVLLTISVTTSVASRFMDAIYRGEAPKSPKQLLV